MKMDLKTVTLLMEVEREVVTQVQLQHNILIGVYQLVNLKVYGKVYFMMMRRMKIQMMQY
jgi:hypothetical protein